MYNPIAQAKILNAIQTEFNVLMGLCVAHNSFFMRCAEAP